MALVNDPKSSWQELYQAALTETDQQKLTDLVMAIEQAMFIRAQGLSASKDDQERASMAEATQKLLIIKTEKLGWPGIKPA
jgi:hypothetical protein